jgi:hypothetical protein
MKAQIRSSVDQKPNAWIVNPNDKGRKSIKKGNKVYLKSGQNFEIELFNPLKESVLSEIKINGKSISKTGLVLRPGERCYLDCFLDDKTKFIFKTYEVENTSESIEAIDLNGNIEVFFYKEETLQINNWKDLFDPVIQKHYYYPYPVYCPYPVWYNTYPTFGGTLYNNCTYTSSVNLNGNSTINSSYSSGSGTLSIGSNGSLTYGSLSNTINNTSNLQDYTKKIETGRVEKGEQSTQNFEEIKMKFQSCIICSVIYKLLPESSKPVETKDLKPVKSNSDVVELIKKLAELHDLGILTDDEFSSKKQELLSKI